MAKQTKSRRTTPQSARQRRQEAVESAARRRRNQNLLLGGGAVVLVALIGLVIYLNVRAQAPVSGEEAFATQGNVHIDQGTRSPIEYNSTPPTSGPHYGNLAAWNIYEAYSL
jgi:hypothetical protein